jgi:hypothetical protein
MKDYSKQIIMTKTISYFKNTLLFILAITLLQSCEIGDLPNSDNTNIDRLKWSYDFETVMAFSLQNNVPAVDEKGNIYFAADVQAGGQIAKLSPDGNELWSINEADFPLSQVIYFNEKIFYQNDNQLVCRDANDGSELWSTQVVFGFNTFALTPEKIYTSNFVDGGMFGCNNSLVAFDHAGNKVWETKIKYSPNDTIAYPNAISVNGNNIYLGIFVEVDNSEFAILNYVDEGNSVTKNWSWLAPDDYSVGGGSPWIRDFAIDDNSNLLFGMENRGTQFVFSLSDSGTENWRTASSMPKIISSVSVDSLGNCYTAYSSVEKINANSIVWSSEDKVDWQYEGFTSKAPIIGKEGNLTYENVSRIAASVSPEGANLWEQFYGCNLCNDEFHNVTINRNGDIIVIGKANIYCFDGNGQGLSNTGWPKKYGNYGNTSSR